jgi:hypothetical protein
MLPTHSAWRIKFPFLSGIAEPFPHPLRSTSGLPADAPTQDASMNDGLDDARPASSRWRLQFSLLALLIFTTLVAVLLAWWVQPERVVATALFHIDSSPSKPIAGPPSPIASDQEFEILKKTQLALLRSNFVLTAALRNPKVGALPILQGREDPVEWLQSNLEVDFPENAEILSIRLHGVKKHEVDLVEVVNAVAKAYKDEVVNEHRQRQFSSRDLLARSLDNLNNEIKRKMEDYLDIARESGSSESGGGRMLQELDMKRLDRVEDEIARLEGQLAGSSEGNGANSKSIEQRLSALHKRQEELEKKLTSRADKSSDLETRQRDLDQLQRIAGEMSQRLEVLDIESSGPDRIRQVQPAVISAE